MKKLFSYCLVICLFFSCFGCAAEPATNELNVESTIFNTPCNNFGSQFNQEDYVWEQLIFSDQPATLQK